MSALRWSRFGLCQLTNPRKSLVWFLSNMFKSHRLRFRLQISFVRLTIHIEIASKTIYSMPSWGCRQCPWDLHGQKANVVCPEPSELQEESMGRSKTLELCQGGWHVFTSQKVLGQWQVVGRYLHCHKSSSHCGEKHSNWAELFNRLPQGLVDAIVVFA